MDFKEACSVAADLYEAAPELWTAFKRGEDETGCYVDPTHPSAIKWCAGGMVLAALNDRADSIRVFGVLRPFAEALGYSDAAEANNHGGRKVAIKMLRLASGELAHKT